MDESISLVIMIAGQQYAGKTEVGLRLKKRLAKIGIPKGAIAYTPIARGLKDIYCAYKGITRPTLEETKAAHREELQALGDDLRKVRPDMLMVMALSDGRGLPIRIVDDVRYQSEIDFFSAHCNQVIVIQVDADADTRRIRCETLHGPGSYAGANHASEQIDITSKSLVIDNSHWNQGKLDAYLNEVWDRIVAAVDEVAREPKKERRGRPRKDQPDQPAYYEDPTPSKSSVDLPPLQKPSAFTPDTLVPQTPSQTPRDPEAEDALKHETDNALNALFNEKN